MAIKRTWVVYINSTADNAQMNSITDSNWYGPYLRAQAEQLAIKVNTMLTKQMRGAVAVAMPLLTLTPNEVLAQFDKSFLEI